MTDKINFGSGIYFSNIIKQRTNEDALEKINNYAKETNTDIFITRMDEGISSEKNMIYSVVAKDGKLYFQIFDESKIKNPITYDINNTRIAGNPIDKEAEECEQVASMEEIYYKEGKALLKKDDSCFSGYAVKKNSKENTLMVFKFVDGKIVSSKKMDENNNLISGRIYCYDGTKHLRTISYGLKDTLFIEHDKDENSNSTIVRDEEFAPKKLVQYFPKEKRVVLYNF